MTAPSDGIVGTMTIREAAICWQDPRSGQLHYWAETFGVALKDFHAGHIQTYQLDRGKQVPSSQVDAEVEALLVLLTEVGLGQEILPHYRSFGDPGELTPAEINALPPSIRKYIERMKQEISDLQASNQRMENRIRRTNWGRSR